MKTNPLYGLRDFYQPLPPPWTPQTAAWYVVFAVVLLVAGWAVWRMFIRWRHNRYRREALRELGQINIAAVPNLLKRTALAAWPREEVASLSGEAWLHFLETHGNRGSFAAGPGRLLLDIEYRDAHLESGGESALRQIAGDWIRSHRVRP